MAKEYSRADSIVQTNPQQYLLKCVRENKIKEIHNILEDDNNLVTSLYEHPHANKTILHIACEDLARVVKPETIQCLIKNGASLKYCNEQWEWKQAIHFAVLGLNPAIIQTIIDNLEGNEINSTAKGNTALNILIKQGDQHSDNFEECIKILLDSGININIADNKNRTPLYWAQKKKKENAAKIIDEHDQKVMEDDKIENTYDTLLSLLKDKNEDLFVYRVQQGKINEQNREFTLLQFACERNLVKAVDALVKNGYDPNMTTDKHKDTPLLIAAKNGFHKIFKILIENRATFSNEILPLVLARLDYSSSADSDYREVYRLLENRTDWDPNYKDDRDNFLLHYAAKYGGPEIVSDLLKRKASLANRNRYGTPTISDVDFDTLETHFDSCIQAIPANHLDREGLKFTFDFTTLIPSQVALSNEPFSCKTETGDYLVRTPSKLMPECDAVLFMSQSSELKHLLKHPLIISFLYVKWHKIRWIFYINFLFYLLFCIFLIAHAIFYDSTHEASPVTFSILLVITILIVFRELFQILGSFKKYFLNIENIVEWMLIITVFLFLFTSDEYYKKQFCAFALLFAAFEFLFFLGNYPDLSTNIVMLRTVSKNFCKLLSFYFILILAFAFCFHTLFNNTHTDDLNRNVTAHSNKTSDNDNDNIQFFTNPLISIFKTIIMLTGEYEAGEIKFNLYPGASYVIFLLFVLTIAVVLLNLLNGIAVSDTQEIKNEAKLVAQIARAEYVAYTESMVFQQVWPYRVRNSVSFKNVYLSKFFKSFAKIICISQEYLVNGGLTVLPNQKGRILINNDKLNKIYLNKGTLKRTVDLIRAKQKEQRVLQENLKLLNNQIVLRDKLVDLTLVLNELKRSVDELRSHPQSD